MGNSSNNKTINKKTEKNKVKKIKKENVEIQERENSNTGKEREQEALLGLEIFCSS